MGCEEQIQLHYLPVCHLLFSPNSSVIQILPAGRFPPFKWLLARPNLAVPFYFLHLNETANRESAFGARKIELWMPLFLLLNSKNGDLGARCSLLLPQEAPCCPSPGDMSLLDARPGAGLRFVP